MPAAGIGLHTHREDLKMIDVHWTTDYEGMSNSFGYHVHNSRARQAVTAAGVCLSETAPVAIHVVPSPRFEPIPGKINIIYTAWEASELPELFRESLAPADAICLTAEYLRKPFAEMFPDKSIFVVPLGVDESHFPYIDRMSTKYRPIIRQRTEKPFRFLWVGAPNARKGGLHVLEAFSPFAGNPAFELYIKTSMPDDARSKVGIRREGNVIYDDRRVPIQELASLYHKSHCFVFPSGGEGFGLTFAEALCTGLPAIYPPATSLTGIAPPELRLGYPVRFKWTPEDWSWSNVDAKGTSMQVHVNVANVDCNDLAAEMVAVTKDVPAAFERGRRAADYVRRMFTWERTGDALRQVIERFHPACLQGELAHG